MNLELLAREIVDAAFTIHREIGPGLLESAYQFCLFEELTFREIKVEKEVYLPLYYRQKKKANAFRVDLLVENKIIIELKAVEELHPLHAAQLLTYLKLSGHQLGFLINFNATYFKKGIKRMVNNYNH